LKYIHSFCIHCLFDILFILRCRQAAVP